MTKKKPTGWGGARHHPPGRAGGRPSHQSKGLRTVVKKSISFQPGIFDYILEAKAEGETLSGTVNRLLLKSLLPEGEEVKT
jgi:hypothetical protein